MSKFQVVEHPLIQHKLSILRRKEASTKEFRELVDFVRETRFERMGAFAYSQEIYPLKMSKSKHPFKKRRLNKSQVKN